EQADMDLVRLEKGPVEQDVPVGRLAPQVGDADIPRPWSRHSKGSSAFDRATDEELAAQKKRKERLELERKSREEAAAETTRKANLLASIYEDSDNPTDPKLSEYLSTMRPRSAARGPTWANDDVIAARKQPGGEGLLVTKTHVKFDLDDDEYADLPAANVADDEDEDLDAGDAAETDEMEEDDESRKVALNPNLSDKEYFQSKMKLLDEVCMVLVLGISLTTSPNIPILQEDPMVVNEDETTGESVDPPVESGDASESEDVSSAAGGAATTGDAVEDEDAPPAELIADTGRLYVRNLAFCCTVEDLHKLFEKFGPLSEVHIPIEKDTKKPRGYAFVLFLIPEHAVKAYIALDGSIFQGRILEVLPGKDKPHAPEEDTTLGPNAFKAKKEKKRKEAAGNEFSWNSLFMNSNAVAESMAQKLGVKKSDILDADSENMAVRLALAETHVITETKQYLEDEGINLDAFEKRKTRSNTIILVKNITHKTEEEELQELFGKFGSLGRVVLPPARTIALVEFLEPNEAKAAFKRLAYSNFHSLPLFLEWAPVGTFATKFDPAAEGKKKKERAAAVPARTSAAVDSVEPDAAPARTAPVDDDTDAAPAATLFVKNLNFDTREEGLRLAFEGVGGLRSVRVAMKPDRAGQKLSMGFGFLEFAAKEDAVRCMKSMQ
ncbi:hypothetical protein BDK51DRAFT_15034, partial [Blyttiomyces helicus]